MERRHFLLGAAALALLSKPARAHHGWGGYDAARPIYLAGTVQQAKWQDPHGELVIAVPADLALPADLRTRTLPSQRWPVDGAELLRRAELPKRRSAEWTIELAPPSRLQAWQLEEIPQGETVEVIGYVLRMENAPAYLRAEYLFHDGTAYALRSAPD